MTDGAGSEQRIPYYYNALAMALPTIMLGLQLSGWIAFQPMIRSGHADFRNLYTAGYMVRTGHADELYDYAAQKNYQDAVVSREEVAIPFIRPAYQAVLFAPFSLLAFHQAYYAFLGLNLAMLVLCFRLLRPYMENLSGIWPMLPAAMFVFLPVGTALMQGQDSIVLLALLAGALASIQRGRETLAGVLVGLGLFKFQLVIPIALLFLAWRRWRFSAGFAGAAMVAATISIWIAGWKQSANYFRGVMQIGVSHGLSSGLPLPVDHMANLHGAMWAIAGESSLVLPLTIATSAATFIFLAIRRPAGTEALLVAIPASALVSYYMFIHDMCILLIPIALTLDRFARAGQTNYRHARMQAAAAVLLFVAPACISLLPANSFWVVALALLAFTVAICMNSQLKGGGECLRSVEFQERQ
jgi:hypothetical protein